jgi:hypothetical protein
MNKIYLILINVFILVLIINFISASDVLVWQGQYYTGTTFNTGTYEFNFSVYDNLTGGNTCYSNITTLTTGSFGEWKTEQIGVNSACNNVSKDYYLNININGVDQTPRRRLTIFQFLRKDVDEITAGKLQTASRVTASIINATQVTASEITVSSNANILGILRGHSPLKIGDSIQYVDINDANLFSVYTAGQNITGNNVSSDYYGAIIHQIETHTNPSDIEECWWDKEDQEMRMCMDKTKVEFWNSLLVHENINVTGNVTASKFIGDGSLLTGLSSGSWLIPIYLESNLNATNGGVYTTLFTIALTPNKMNIVKAYLVQSTSTSGVAVQNRAIVSEAGPIGYCNFVIQNQAGTESINNIAVSTDSADTADTIMGLNINTPFICTVTCTVLADANNKNLIIQFESETVANVTTYAGSYYTNAVN